MVAAYTKAFYDIITKNMPVVRKSFDKNVVSTTWERYLLNMVQFTAAKNRLEISELKSVLYDTKKIKKEIEQFRIDAKPILSKFGGRLSYFDAECDLAYSGAVAANEWQDIWSDRGNYPYFKIITAKDEKVCSTCGALDGLIISITSTEGQKLYVPQHYRCRCKAIKYNEGSPIGEKEIKKYLRLKPDNFQRNVGINGIFPNENTYFDKFNSANEFNFSFFGADRGDVCKLNTATYTDYQCKLALNEWKKDNADIIFSNHDWMLNIRLSQKSLEKISKKTRGFQNIKNAIENPSEIWMRWANDDLQDIVLTNYVLHDKNYSYIVETKAGEIIDAYFRTHTDSKRLRQQGIKLMK